MTIEAGPIWKINDAWGMTHERKLSQMGNIWDTGNDLLVVEFPEGHVTITWKEWRRLRAVLNHKKRPED